MRRRNLSAAARGTLRVVLVWLTMTAGLVLFPVVFPGLVPPRWLSGSAPFLVAGFVGGRRLSGWRSRLVGALTLTLFSTAVWVVTAARLTPGVAARLPLTVGWVIASGALCTVLTCLGMALGAKTTPPPTSSGLDPELDDLEQALRDEVTRQRHEPAPESREA